MTGRFEDIDEQYGRVGGDFEIDATTEAMRRGEAHWGIRQIEAVEERYGVKMKGVGL